MTSNCFGKKVTIDGVEYLLTDPAKVPSPLNEEGVVLIRTRNAGIHVGRLASLHTQGVDTTRVLNGATRVWRWKGANTLSELSQKGGDTGYTRISEPVPEITLTECLEIIPCSALAAVNLRTPRWPA